MKTSWTFFLTTLSDYSFIHSSAFSGHLLTVYCSALCKSKNIICKSHGPYPWEIRICLQSIWKESGNDYMCFLDSSVGKVSVCNAGDPHLIPGSGRSAGEGLGYPLQYFGASLVAQMVKKPPPMQETWAQSLGWEDPLEKGKAIHSSVLGGRISWTV